jgi:hypothetical protein
MKDSDRGKDSGMRGQTNVKKYGPLPLLLSFMGGGGANDPGDLSKTTQAICLNNF